MNSKMHICRKILLPGFLNVKWRVELMSVVIIVMYLVNK
jgi:hypothetical protein